MDNGKMAGVAGLEPVTSAVTGQRSNQLSYTPVKGILKLKNFQPNVKDFSSLERAGLHESCFGKNKIWAADAKEVGVGDPAEETCCHPDVLQCDFAATFCQLTYPKILNLFVP
jgi:hypothetical protein